MSKQENTVKKRLAGAYVSSVLSISLVLVLVGLAALVGVNARSVSRWFKEHMQMEVLLRNEVAEKQAKAFQARLDSLPYINSTRLITREEGIEELRQMLGQDFLDVFESTSVPLSLELTLKADYVNADSIAMVSSRISECSLVDDVESRTPLVDTLNANLSTLSIVVGVLVLLLLFISFVLISNTIRLNIYARRFTVHTMQLVGASRAFIRRPFMRNAIIMGAVGSLIAVLALGGAIYFAWKSFPQLLGILSPQGLAIVAGIIMAVGVMICLVSTYFVVNRLTGMQKDKLYY